MKLDSIHTVYFVGIGGIGMSALARYFLSQKKRVAGYDKTPSPVTKELEELGINICFDEEVSHIRNILEHKDGTLVVYTPAVPSDHKHLKRFRECDFKVLKRSEVLGMITGQRMCLAVAGTHGKTTTTSILAHLLYTCNEPVTAFLGGISENYNSNLITKGDKVMVVEADEFDRSFLTLNPDLACITSMDADHLDVYGNAEELKASFKSFAERIKPEGTLFVNNGLSLEGVTYGIEDDSDYCAQNVRISKGSYHFDFRTPHGTYNDFQFNLPGRHNLSNATIALAMAAAYGCPHQQLAKGLASYRGVKRRFTYQIKSEEFIFIDDYAHHPEEIEAVYDAVREMYPNQRNLVVFQPHLYSRTRDFAEGFAESLSKFDEVLLLEIYPARERPIEGVSSQWLLEKIKCTHKKLVQKTQLISSIQQSDAQVILTLGAGDIGQEVQLIKKALSHEN